MSLPSHIIYYAIDRPDFLLVNHVTMCVFYRFRDVTYIGRKWRIQRSHSEGFSQNFDTIDTCEKPIIMGTV